MKGKIKKILSLSLFLIFVFLLPFNIEARSGCCSHHGGVCGCGCCDGTSLSATCAPYYPQCSQSPPPVKQESPTPRNNLPNSTNNSNEYTAQVSNANSNFIWWLLAGLGGGGFVAYLFLRKKG